MYLGGQDDQQATEDVDKVEEKIERLPDKVIVATIEFLHDELRVKQNESTEEEKTKVEFNLCVCVCPSHVCVKN